MASRRRQWDGPGVEAWVPWTPAELAERLAGSRAPWCVVGGWAIDLHIGAQTRDHGDIEIATTRTALPAIRQALADFAFYAVGDGTARRLGVDEPAPADRHQHWVLDERLSAWRVDVMVEPGDAERWAYRRDERVHAPRRAMVATTDQGIPYLKPHGTLLYKAKAVRPKDLADLGAVLPHVDPADRTWLAHALEAVHPGHPWLERLT